MVYVVKRGDFSFYNERGDFGSGLFVDTLSTAQLRILICDEIKKKGNKWSWPITK